MLCEFPPSFPSVIAVRSNTVPYTHCPVIRTFNVWFGVCICWSTITLCSEVWIGKEVLSLGHRNSQYPTVVYMTLFPNDEIGKFFFGFDGTLSIQYHELKPINIVLSYTMPWPNINNLTIYCVMVVLWLYMVKDSVIELFLSIVLLFFNVIYFDHLICFMYCILLAIRLPFVNKLELSWVEGQIS